MQAWILFRLTVFAKVCKNAWWGHLEIAWAWPCKLVDWSPGCNSRDLSVFSQLACVCVFSCHACMACGVLVSWPGTEPWPWQWVHPFLTSALLGNSSKSAVFILWAWLADTHMNQLIQVGETRLIRLNDYTKLRYKPVRIFVYFWKIFDYCLQFSFSLGFIRKQEFILWVLRKGEFW